MRYCLALDLKQDAALIAEYEAYHRDVWPAIKESISSAGILDMQIWRLEDRMFMIMEVNDTFSFQSKARADSANPKVREWEEFMWKFQQSLPQAKPGEKWLLMEKIYNLNA